LDELHFPGASSRALVDLATKTAMVGEVKNRVVSIEDVTGTPYADRLLGDSAYQTLSGGRGNDYIQARGSIDFLFGDDGDDELRGERGDDLLRGGLGTDVGFGGPNSRFGDYCSGIETANGCER